MKKIFALIGFSFILGFAAFFYSDEKNYDFSLRSEFSQNTSLEDFKGKKLIVYFGYTFCPDVCSTTLSMLSEKLRRINSPKAYLLFITLDLQRDKDIKALNEWLRYFYPHSTALIAPNEKSLQKITKNYGVIYHKIDLPNSAMQYSIAHSNEIYLIDSDSNFKASINDLNPKELLRNLEEFLKE
ncbi:SCO family protein [Campylobacter sp.]|uniref:SCO family protein n=1 Tax=Campylobacter sp. TaxID=205 RepID=UPI0026DC44E0|nr:SCO family protein [Campylobacter sp.]MDO4674267.1 SCO family protein [Campylobacter sp.]